MLISIEDIDGTIGIKVTITKKTEGKGTTGNQKWVFISKKRKRKRKKNEGLFY